MIDSAVFEAIPFTVTRNEVEPHAAYKESFFAVPTTGLRNAPEELVLELFREVFFGANRHTGTPVDTKQRNLDPDTLLIGNEARAVLYSLRGRTKRRASATKSNQTNHYYAPAFPRLAAHGWFRKQSDVALRQLLLDGALASSLSPSDRQREANELANQTVVALDGGALEPRDLLHIAANAAELPPEMFGTEQATSWLAERFQRSKFAIPSGLNGSSPDGLAIHIANDWRAICRLEPKIPRLEWIQVLKAFLCVSAGMWLLAQMRMTAIVRDALREGLCGGPLPDPEGFSARIGSRNIGLLDPTETLCNPIPTRVAEFMAARVELNALLHAGAANGSVAQVLEGRILSTFAGSGLLPVTELSRALQEAFPGEQGEELLRGVQRASEGAKAWRDPLAQGTTGNNLDEFLRVLTDDRADSTDNGFLLHRAPTVQRLYRVFPSSRLLSLFAHLAAVDQDGRVARVVPLSRIERHFGEYGIDFARAGGARTDLIKRLEQLGLLRGAPDAGSAVMVSVEYTSSVGGGN
ncbi:MAG: hypothetical protein V4558_05660 [Gemmatimonadota bacterium]